MPGVTSLLEDSVVKEELLNSGTAEEELFSGVEDKPGSFTEELEKALEEPGASFDEIASELPGTASLLELRCRPPKTLSQSSG